MSVPLVINGVTFQYPQQFDLNWGPTLTNWSTAVTNGMLQKSGGAFTLTSEVDFGASFGLKALSYKSKESNISSTGILRLANASTGLGWRNAANNADLLLTVNSSNQLTFNGTSIGATTSLTDGHILVGNASNQPADVAMSGDATIVNTGVVTIANGAINNAKVNASAAIALSKLAPTTAYYWYIASAAGVATPLAVTASRAVVTDSNGSPTASAATATEVGYLSGVGSAIQTQINERLPLSGGTMSGVINMSNNKINSLAQGSTTGDAIAFPITLSLLPSITQIQSSVSGSTTDRANTITTKAITTTGGTVLIFALAAVSCSQAGSGSSFFADLEFNVTRGGTSIPGAKARVQAASSTSNIFITSPTIVAIDAPTAGTYTYNFTYLLATGTGGSIVGYSFILLELLH